MLLWSSLRNVNLILFASVCLSYQVVTDIKKAKRPITLFFRSEEMGDRDLTDYIITPTEFDVTFGEGSLGILIHKRKDEDRGAVVTGFKKQEDGSMGKAEACGKISPGQLLIAINGKSTLSMNFKKTIKAFVKAPRPITLTLRKQPDFDVTIKEKAGDRIAFEPLAMRLASLDGLVIVTGFEQLPGQAQQSGEIRTGMRVTAVAGQPVTGSTIASAIKAAARPVIINFADPASGEEVAVTFHKGPIGIRFRKDGAHVVVKSFSKSKGPVERGGQVLVGHVLTHVEGEAVGDDLQLACQLIRQKLDDSQRQKLKRKITLTFRDMDLYFELYPNSPKRTAVANPNT